MEKIAYKEMFENEISHGWYVGTRSTLLMFLKKSLKKNARILDAGCGTGGTMVFLKKNGFVNVEGVDTNTIALSYCRKRGLKKIKKASINSLPYNSKSFDCVICLDVLYHNGVLPTKAIGEFKKVLKPSGLLYIQEPAHDWLKSSHDKLIETRKRFKKEELVRILKKQNFRIIKDSYFNTIFAAPIVVKRLIGKIKFDGKTDVQPISGPMNKILEKSLILEGILIKFIKIPFGISIICIARKNVDNS